MRPLIVKLPYVFYATTILFCQFFINFMGKTSFNFLSQLLLIVNTWKHPVRNVVLMLCFLITDVNIWSWVRNHVREHFFDHILLLFCVSSNGCFLELKLWKKGCSNSIRLRIFHRIIFFLLHNRGRQRRTSHFYMTLSCVEWCLRGSGCWRVVFFLKTHLSFYFDLLGPIFEVMFTYCTDQFLSIHILFLIPLLFVISQVVNNFSRILTNYWHWFLAFVFVSTVLLLNACNHFILELIIK